MAALKRGWSLRRRLALTFGIAGLVLVAVTVAGALAFANLVSERDAVIDRVDPASASATDLLLAYVDQETAVRGYVISGQPEFLDSYREGQDQARKAIATLERLLHPDSRAARDLRNAEQRGAQWERQYAQPAVNATDAGSRAFDNDKATAKGNVLFEQVRAAFNPLQNQLDQERNDARHRLIRASDVLLGVLLASLLVLLLTGIVVWRSLRRWVTIPLGALGNDARQVTTGDLTHPVAPRGPPDIADLADGIDAMRRRIVEELTLVQGAERALAARNEDLARSNSELEQFAYVASHDLQEPLRKVTSFCQLLEQRYAGQLDERADQYIAFAVDGAKRMQILINDLLAFSRVGRTTERFRIVNLRTCVEVAERSLAAAIEEASARVEIEEQLPTVFGDPGLLAAVMQNLIGNAVKFRGAVPPVVRLSSERDEHEWTISVEDNGIGIEPRFADRIFVIFQRLHGREAYSGTGIGLALCKKIVEFHGGRIWLDTEHTPGTRFCFTLPVLDEKSPPDEPDD